MQTTTKATHTPGPWYAGLTNITSTTGSTAISFGVPGKEIGALNPDHCDTQEADSRLIAAAPELLEACKTILLNLDPSGDHPKSQHVLYSDCLGPENDDQTIVEYLKGVISKAEGNV